MKLSKDKRQEVMLYICDKIAHRSEGITKSTAETFNISQTTANTYLIQLQKDGIIRKVKRDKYELVKETTRYTLSRKDGELVDEESIYKKYISDFISPLPKEVQAIWEYAFSEMCNNVIDHSEAENLNLLIQIDYMNTCIILYDDGVGIFEKIKNYFSFDSIEEAKDELFKGKLTTDKSRHSGEGIFFTSKLMDTFIIYSDKTMFTINKFDEVSYNDIDIDLHAKGTCVYMKLSNRSNKSIKSVFDFYSTVDDGFIKTRIPLRQYFDITPVSRSQAKRLCNRLNSFKEAELDFDGIEWMGQGFAHQIFVVFANENPDVKIVPVNMCDDVEKMYYHVINTKIV